MWHTREVPKAKECKENEEKNIKDNEKNNV
jgi:hypothetical protein